MPDDPKTGCMMSVEGEVQLISDLEKEMKAEKQCGGSYFQCEQCNKVLTRRRAKGSSKDKRRNEG